MQLHQQVNIKSKPALGRYKERFAKLPADNASAHRFRNIESLFHLLTGLAQLAKRLIDLSHLMESDRLPGSLAG
jgi:hypothetical protein